MVSMLNIVTGAPIWVWPLLAVLIFLGLRSSRDRNVTTRRYWFVPLFGLLGLVRIETLAHPAVATIVFVGLYLAGAGLGFRLQRRWILKKTDMSVRIKGEWLTLAILLILFATSFVDGALAAIDPAVTDVVSYTILSAAVRGLASGSFLGRAARVLRAEVDSGKGS